MSVRDRRNHGSDNLTVGKRGLRSNRRSRRLFLEFFLVVQRLALSASQDTNSVVSPLEK